MIGIELRKGMLRIVVLATVVILGVSSSNTDDTSGANRKSKPHILLIVADDLGWNDVSWHNPQVVTPNLEELALGGVILNRSYVQPICTPTRSALLTGRYPFTIGRQRSTLRPCEPTGLTLNASLLPQALKEAGYTTHAVGKWHLGFCSWAFTPTYRGFDTFYGYYNGAEDYFTHLRSNLREYFDDNWPFSTKPADDVRFGLDLRNNTEPDPTKGGVYSPHLFASYVENLLQTRDSSKPMFLYLPFQSVHAPLMVPANYTKPYRYIRDFNRRTYLGMVTALDEAVGRVVQALKTTGHYNNSVIVFTTDNGGTCKHGGNNWPLRGMKTTLWEGGTRGVAFVHSPLLPNPGTVSNKMLHATDWFRTLVSLGGGVGPIDSDGFDQWKAISGSSPSPRKRMVYNIDKTENLRASVRVGNYKLIVGFPGEGDWTPPPERKVITHEKEEAASLSSPLSSPNEVSSDSIFHDGSSHPSLTNRNLNWGKQDRIKSPFSVMFGEYFSTLNNDAFAYSGQKGNQDKAEDGNSKESVLSSKVNRKRYLIPGTFTSNQNESPSFKKRPASLSILDGMKSSSSVRYQPQRKMINRTITSSVHPDAISRGKRPNKSQPKDIFETEALIGKLFNNAGLEDHRLILDTETLPQKYFRGPSLLGNSVILHDDAVTWESLRLNQMADDDDPWLSHHAQEWRLILKNNTEIRLYNVQDDPEERVNLAEEMTHKVKFLLEFLLDEIVNRYVPADIKDEVPSANPKFWNNTWSPGWCTPD